MTEFTQEKRAAYLLRHADNALVLGQRLSEWCGHAPELEEDLALANIALDLLGQARLLLSYAFACIWVFQPNSEPFCRLTKLTRNVILNCWNLNLGRWCLAHNYLLMTEELAAD